LVSDIMNIDIESPFFVHGNFLTSTIFPFNLDISSNRIFEILLNLLWTSALSFPFEMIWTRVFGRLLPSLAYPRGVALVSKLIQALIG
jgi:hypothetical protein